MTEQQERLLQSVESRVRQLMLRCEALQQENTALRGDLSDTKTSLVECRERLDAVTKKYDDLCLAQGFSGKSEELALARQRLSKMVREVNACLALVNE